MEKLFSFILPVYNVEPYLDRCVESILVQGGDDYEIILVDDGSKDRSGELCDRWAEKQDRVRVIHKPNGGLASARNAGLDAAVGRYVLMIDSDDYVEPTLLEILREEIRKSEAEIIHFDYIMNIDDRILEKPGTCRTGFYNGKEVAGLLEQILLDPGCCQLSAWAQAYRLDFLNRNGLRFVSERLVLSEDFLFNLCTFHCAQSVTVTHHLLYHYIIRSGSLSQGAKPRMFERYTELYQRARDFLISRNASEELLRKLNRYYVYYLIYGTCVSYEYCDRPERTRKTAAVNVRKMLDSATLMESVRNMDLIGLSMKERVKIGFIRLRFEPGLAFSFRKGLKRAKS